MAGYGTDNRYESKTMINRFSAKSQISFLGSLNNLNNSGVNVSDFVSMTGGGSQGGGMRNMNFNSGARYLLDRIIPGILKALPPV